MARSASRSRETKETKIAVAVELDGAGTADVSTGLPFFDHMLDQLGRHGGLDLTVHAIGDLEIDAHHTVEDVGITLGRVFKEALGDKAGIRRFASVRVPLDEALIDIALDISGRPYLVYEVDPGRERIGTFDPQLMEEFWRAFVHGADVTLHIRQVSGRNAHHIVECQFKALARALRYASERDPRAAGILPSTKGAL